MATTYTYDTYRLMVSGARKLIREPHGVGASAGLDGRPGYKSRPGSPVQ